MYTWIGSIGWAIKLKTCLPNFLDSERTSYLASLLITIVVFIHVQDHKTLTGPDLMVVLHQSKFQTFQIQFTLIW